MIVSWLTGMNKPSEMDPDLLSPVIHKYILYPNEKEMVDIKLLEAHKVSIIN